MHSRTGYCNSIEVILSVGNRTRQDASHTTCSRSRRTHFESPLIPIPHLLHQYNVLLWQLVRQQRQPPPSNLFQIIGLLLCRWQLLYALEHQGSVVVRPLLCGRRETSFDRLLEVDVCFPALAYGATGVKACLSGIRLSRHARVFTALSATTVGARHFIDKGPASNGHIDNHGPFLWGYGDADPLKECRLLWTGSVSWRLKPVWRPWRRLRQAPMSPRSLLR